MTEKKTDSSIKKITKKEIEFLSYPNKSYGEEYQNTGFHFAFMSNEDMMCHSWIKCRDFLQDALRNQLTGRNDEIYSFNYKPEVDPKIDTKITRLLVKREPTPTSNIEKTNFNEMIKSSLALVNHYEKIYKFSPRSKLISATHKDKDQYVYLFRGPGIWSQGPIMISMYTFLIRLGYFKLNFTDEETLMKEYERIITLGKTTPTNDMRYLKVIYKNLHKILEHKEKHLFKKKGWRKGNKILFQDDRINKFHSGSGIVALSEFRTPIKDINDKFREILKKSK